MVPFPTLLEPVAECMVVGFLASLCFTYISGVSFVLSYLTHIAMWMTMDYILLCRLEVRMAIVCTVGMHIRTYVCMCI